MKALVAGQLVAYEVGPARDGRSKQMPRRSGNRGCGRSLFDFTKIARHPRICSRREAPRLLRLNPDTLREMADFQDFVDVQGSLAKKLDIPLNRTSARLDRRTTAALKRLAHDPSAPARRRVASAGWVERLWHRADLSPSP